MNDVGHDIVVLLPSFHGFTMRSGAVETRGLGTLRLFDDSGMRLSFSHLLCVSILFSSSSSPSFKPYNFEHMFRVFDRYARLGYLYCTSYLAQIICCCIDEDRMII